MVRKYRQESGSRGDTDIEMFKNEETETNLLTQKMLSWRFCGEKKKKKLIDKFLNKEPLYTV